MTPRVNRATQVEHAGNGYRGKSPAQVPESPLELLRASSSSVLRGSCRRVGLSISARAENRSDDPGCIHTLLSRISLFFVFAIDLGQLTTTLLTINKYWTPLVFHSRHPRCRLSALSFYCRVRDGVGQHG